jgi:hypothetical protein
VKQHQNNDDFRRNSRTRLVLVFRINTAWILSLWCCHVPKLIENVNFRRLIWSRCRFRRQTSLLHVCMCTILIAPWSWPLAVVSGSVALWPPVLLQCRLQLPHNRLVCLVFNGLRASFYQIGEWLREARLIRSFKTQPKEEFFNEPINRIKSLPKGTIVSWWRKILAPHSLNISNRLETSRKTQK